METPRELTLPYNVWIQSDRYGMETIMAIVNYANKLDSIGPIRNGNHTVHSMSNSDTRFNRTDTEWKPLIVRGPGNDEIQSDRYGMETSIPVAIHRI